MRAGPCPTAASGIRRAEDVPEVVGGEAQTRRLGGHAVEGLRARAEARPPPRSPHARLPNAGWIEVNAFPRLSTASAQRHRRARHPSHRRAAVVEVDESPSASAASRMGRGRQAAAGGHHAQRGRRAREAADKHRELGNRAHDPCPRPGGRAGRRGHVRAHGVVPHPGADADGDAERNRRTRHASDPQPGELASAPPRVAPPGRIARRQHRPLVVNLDAARSVSHLHIVGSPLHPRPAWSCGELGGRCSPSRSRLRPCDS